MSEFFSRRTEESEWKNIIFLPFNNIWCFSIVFTHYVLFVLCVYQATYDVVPTAFDYLYSICDTLYIVDVVCVLMHYNMKSTSKLRNIQARHWILVTIDLASLIPFSFTYDTLFLESNTSNRSAVKIMVLNRCFRIYRLYLFFSAMKIQPMFLKGFPVLLFAEMLTYLFLISHTLTCLWYSVSSNYTCEDSSMACLFRDETAFILLVTHYWRGEPFVTETMGQRVVVCITLFISFFLVYGYIIPLFVFALVKAYRPFFEFYKRHVRLVKFGRNIISSKYLMEEVIKHYETIWYRKTETRRPELMGILPLSLQKDTLVDIFWEALRHSEIFRDVSLNCKRSLSLCMRTEFLNEGDVVLDKGSPKTRMIYLVTGVFQIMAEENDRSPVLSLSSGTVLGETSLFFQLNSKVILRCANHCKVHVLDSHSLFRVLQDYPNDRKKCFYRLQRRILMGKLTQWRKQTLCKRTETPGTNTQDTLSQIDDSVKWIKRQWRAVSEVHRRHLFVMKCKQDGVNPGSWHPLHEPEIRLEYISNYLDLLVLSDSFEVKLDVVCLQTSIPWLFAPHSSFQSIWWGIIIVITLFISLTYPYYTAWPDFIPKWLYDISLITSVCFTADLVISLSTAIESKEVIITDFKSIFLIKIRSFAFYADVIAGFPIHPVVALAAGADNLPPHILGIVLSVALFKVYRLFEMFQIWYRKFNSNSVFVCMVRHIFFALLFIYWAAAAINLIWLELMLEHVDPEWEAQNQNQSSISRDLFPVVYASLLALSIPSDTIHPPDKYGFGIVLVVSGLAFLYFIFWLCDYIATFILDSSYELKFATLLKQTQQFMNSKDIPSSVKSRVIKMMNFQWYYDNGSYIMDHTSLFYDAPPDIQRRILRESVCVTLRDNIVFKEENKEFIESLAKKSPLIAMPAGSALINFGAQTMRVYVIHKGFCQVNSALQNDVRGGLSSPLLFGPGQGFPLIVALTQYASPVSVVTLTDCELISIDLETLLGEMTNFGMFKNVVDSLNSLDLSTLLESEVALTQNEVPFNTALDEKKMYEAPYKIHKGFCIFQFLLMKKGIDLQGIKYLAWETSRVICSLISAVMWPMFHGLLIYYTGLLYFLSILDFLALIDLYVRLHVTYYNDQGILVRHTLYTAFYYLKSSFIVDILGVLPIYIIAFYGFFSRTECQGLKYCICINILLKLLQIYRVLGYISYRIGIGQSNFIRYSIMLMVFLSAFINYKMRWAVDWLQDDFGNYVGFKLDSTRVIETTDAWIPETPGELYISTMYEVTVFLLRAENHIQIEFSYDGFVNYTTSFLGVVIFVLLAAWVTSRSRGSQVKVTIYRDSMQSFIDFLNKERADDKISNAAIDHFEHEWSKKQGENLKETFNRLPQNLHEDLMYPIYRKTLSSVRCLSDANEAFYKTLCRYLTEEHYVKETLIIFEEQVQENIYFVHVGYCYSRDTNTILPPGSMFGDIKRTGIMTNDISSKSHVTLLAISSSNFYTILNNFYYTERVFMERIELERDYVAGQLRRVSSSQLETLMKSQIQIEESAVFKSTRDKAPTEEPIVKKRFGSVIHPDTLLSHLFNIVFLWTAYVTCLVIPILYVIRRHFVAEWIIVGFLDLLWILKIFTSFRLAIMDEQTGDIILDIYKIAKKYILAWNGFFIDLLSIIPFELIPVFRATDFQTVDFYTIRQARCCRLLRLVFLVCYLKSESNKLKVRYLVHWTKTFMISTLTINTLTAYRLFISKDYEIDEEGWNWSSEQMDSLIWAYLYVLNLLVHSGLLFAPPNALFRLIFVIVVSFTSVILQILLIEQVLSIVFVAYHTTAEYTYKLNKLEEYLSVRDSSPALQRQVLGYCKELLISHRAEAMPWFLTQTPPTVKIAIMEDLYIEHLKDCYIFGDVKLEFLRQLTARFKREIFFPGDKITEKGDVDYFMYFIHRGEVNVIEHDKTRYSLEYVIDTLCPMDYFGIEQGIWKSTPHTHTYRARTVVEILTLNLHWWKDLRRKFPDIAQNIYAKSKVMSTRIRD